MWLFPRTHHWSDFDHCKMMRPVCKGFCQNRGQIVANAGPSSGIQIQIAPMRVPYLIRIHLFVSELPCKCLSQSVAVLASLFNLLPCRFFLICLCGPSRFKFLFNASTAKCLFPAESAAFFRPASLVDWRLKAHCLD